MSPRIGPAAIHGIMAYAAAYLLGQHLLWDATTEYDDDVGKAHPIQHPRGRLSASATQPVAERLDCAPEFVGYKQVRHNNLHPEIPVWSGVPGSRPSPLSIRSSQVNSLPSCLMAGLIFNIQVT